MNRVSRNDISLYLPFIRMFANLLVKLMPIQMASNNFVLLASTVANENFRLKLQDLKQVPGSRTLDLSLYRANTLLI